MKEVIEKDMLAGGLRDAQDRVCKSLAAKTSAPPHMGKQAQYQKDKAYCQHFWNKCMMI